MMYVLMALAAACQPDCACGHPAPSHDLFSILGTHCRHRLRRWPRRARCKCPRYVPVTVLWELERL